MWKLAWNVFACTGNVYCLCLYFQISSLSLVKASGLRLNKQMLLTNIKYMWPYIIKNYISLLITLFVWHVHTDNLSQHPSFEKDKSVWNGLTFLLFYVRIMVLIQMLISSFCYTQYSKQTLALQRKLMCSEGVKWLSETEFWSRLAAIFWFY